jgi:hypothetical protein
LTETYYEKRVNVAIKDTMEEISKDPAMSQEVRLELSRASFVKSAVDCINDLDARLQRPE